MANSARPQVNTQPTAHPGTRPAADPSRSGPDAETQRVLDDAARADIASIRAMDAWHIATATLLPELATGEPYAFASRDKEQAAVAELRGFTLVCGRGSAQAKRGSPVVGACSQ